MQVFQLLTLLAAAAVVVLADDPKVETPTSAAIAGVPLQIKWNGGSGPFTVVVNTFEVRPFFYLYPFFLLSSPLPLSCSD